MTLQTVFADLHIHIGRTESGQPVKISAAKNLTFDRILWEAAHRKGIQMIGIIDSHSPPVQEEIAEGVESGRYRELPGGGLRYGETTVILGTEIEVKNPGQGAAHLLAYFPTLDRMSRFSQWLSRYVRNMQLSTQRYHGEISALEEKVTEMEGLLIPAHVFTPFKSVYGSAVDRLSQLLRLERITGVELGLSADSAMADGISELSPFSFLSNSDAHSLPKIGREYNELVVSEPDFEEFRRALTRKEGRRVAANYGLDPKLGKYHRTRCANCDELLPSGDSLRCPYCGKAKVIKGVMDRVREVSDQPSQSPDHRPPYMYQVPLEFIPKLGPKTLDKLLKQFGTEMNVLHRAPLKKVERAAGKGIAGHIRLARERRLEFEEGGGGTYGKVKSVEV
ncbi:endonuclease Q family protein [Paludifilum halophilum]|uniref:TIGR00375 family protein n=1 Tax=Paludifilum halophilum TaxID=1642702 RepID=A0A235BBY6_9BACL|nr:endonuclease Q family protein [Paludifilum halophilum]OYD09786.1 TIGR00375 family protein [Paludifilum halophilum]